MLLFGKVPVIPYGTPGTLDIIAGLEDVIKDYDVVLLANHGVLAVGATPLEAFSKTMSLEMLLQTEFIRKVMTRIRIFQKKNAKPSLRKAEQTTVSKTNNLLFVILSRHKYSLWRLYN